MQPFVPPNDVPPLGHSPSYEALATLARAAARGRRPRSAPSTFSAPEVSPSIASAAQGFVDTERSSCGRVVRGERLLQRAVKSPELLAAHHETTGLQRTLQQHLVTHVPHFDEALILARQTLSPVRSLVRQEVWQRWAEREGTLQLRAAGLTEAPDFSDMLTVRLRRLAAALPGSQAGAMLLWQRFDAQELLTLLGRPQRAWWATTARKVRNEGLYRTALELRLYFEGDEVGCPSLVRERLEPLSGAQHKHLTLLVPASAAQDMLDIAYPSTRPPPAHQRAQLLVHIEHWLFGIAASVPQPVTGDSQEPRVPASPSTAGYRRTSVNFAAQHRYLDSQTNRELERRLWACEAELSQRWTPIFKEGVRSLVSALVAEQIVSQGSPATLRGD